MWRYRHFLVRLILLKRNHLCGSTRAKYDQGPAVLVDNSPYESVGDRDPNHVSHWLGNNNNQLGTSRSTRLSYYTLDQLKSLGSFGLLSTWDVDSDCTGIGDTTSIDDNSNNGDSPKIDLSFIPTTADLLELGGLMDYCDVEQQDGLLHQRFYRPRVLNDGITLSVKNDLTLLGHDLEPSSSSHHSRPKFAHISKSHTRKCERSKNEILGDPPSSSPSRTRCNMRFDPDDNRTCRASTEEIVTAVRNQDLSSLRSILTEKRWPDCRSIGAHLDHLFELIIRDCHDVDEALLFFQDFAVCNRRGFLHDLNGIRLACRVARETGSLSATMEILRVFRNMFLVRSPKAMCSIPEKILEEFYGILCSVGSKSDMRKLHESMISHAFVDNSDIFIRVYTEILLQKDDFVSVFDEWKRLSSRYGTTCASDLMWKGIFISVSDLTKRAKLTDELLAHCNQYEHPAAIIANLILVLTQLNQIDAARTIFLKVSVPGRFFKKPVLRIARSEDALRIIENFASLVTECMFAEKRRPECSGAYEQTSSFLSVELLSKLNRFYGMGRSKLKKSNRKSEKLKLYCINEEQLIELTEFIQLIWMQKAEVNNDNGAIDRLISWSTTNRVEIPPKIKQRIDLLRFKCVRLVVAASLHLSSKQFKTLYSGKIHTVNKLLPVEVAYLESKHRDALYTNKARSLQEIIESIEWRGSVHDKIPEKVAKLLSDPREDLSFLSDRQLSVLLHSFGKQCESMSCLRRSVLMAQALNALQERGDLIVFRQNLLDQVCGSGVSIGPLSRNAVLSARVDNGENVSVVEELKTWEASNISPDAETFSSLSRVYAHKANTQGILDIMDYMKANNMSISEAILESFIYSVAKNGNYREAISFVQKYSVNANEVLLRTAIARAAVARKDFSVVVDVIASISSGAKLHQVSNNIYVLDVLFDMLEAGEKNAIEKISPYLTMSTEGPYLAEWHVNPKVFAHSFCAYSEGKLDYALKLYGLLHPKFKNSNFESSLLRTLADRLRDPSYSMDDIFTLGAEMEKLGLIKDHKLFLLEKSMNTDRVCEVVSVLRLHNELEKYLLVKPSLSKGLARGLSDKLTNPNVNKEERIVLIADLATVLFSCGNERTSHDVAALYPIIYVMGGKDINLAIPALNSIKSSRIHREYATALVHQLLTRNDCLSYDKLDRLLDSKAVNSLNISRIQDQITSIVTNVGKEANEYGVRQLNIVARLFALTFPPENVILKSTKAATYVVSQLQSESLSVDRARLLISHLEKQPRIRFSSEDIALGKKALEAKGQVAKAKLLEKLRRKSHAYKRWLQTPLEQLEEEFVHICEDRDHNPAALNTIHEVILNKITSDKVINYVNVEHHLRIIKERNLRNPRIIELAKQMFSSAIRAALLEQKLDIVRKLWEVRISPLSVEDALTYVAMLVLDERLDEADIVSEDLRNSAQTITAGALQIVGDRLENYSDITKMRHLTQYLRSKFNLSPKQLLRIFSTVRLRHLKRLIEEGDLEKASQFMIEETIESNNAFGQYELAAAAIRAGNAGILKSLFDVVKRTHGKEVAFLDLAIIFLEEGRTEQAFKLLDTPKLRISDRKLDYFIRRAVENKRSDVLRGLFTALSKNEKASTVSLNRLLSQLCRLYYKAHDMTELKNLEKEVEHISFPLDKKMREVFKDLKETRRHCDVVDVSRSIKDILRVAITGNLDEAIRRYNEFSESNDIPDWGVVKFSSVLVTNGLEEQSEKLLKQYYDEYGGVHRYARNSSVKEEQVLAALVRVMDNSSKKSFQNALRFYRCLLDGKFCSNKDIYIELFAKQALQNHGVSEAIAELEKLKTFGRVKSLSRTFRLLLLHATKYGTPEEVSQVDVFINATSPLAARRLKGFVNLELGRSALFVESLQGNRLDHNDFSFMVELARKVKSVEVLEGLLHVSAVLLLSSKEKMTIYDELVKIYGKRDDVDNLQRILELVLSEPDKDSFRVTLERIAHFYRCMREDLPQRLQWALQV